MPLYYPDILISNNGIDPLTDSNEIRGSTRSPVANLSALYALAPLAARLKERSTRVYVISEGAYYELIDINNIGNSSGWQLDSGGGLSISNFVSKVSLSGVKNGINATFTIPDVPIAGTEHIFVNGWLQISGSGNDYTISGSTITFEPSNIPESLDTLIASYFK